MRPEPVLASDIAWEALLKLYHSKAENAAEVRPPASLPQPEAFPDWLACDLAHERAAIMEYDAGLPRAKAEALARKVHYP